MGTVTAKENLAQQLVLIFHEPLFQVFIDVYKSYTYLGSERCMDILNVFVFGTILHILLQWYRDKHKVLQMAGKNFGRMLRTERRVTQEDPVSLKIFNIVVDAVVRAVMLEVCGPQEANNGFG